MSVLIWVNLMSHDEFAGHLFVIYQIHYRLDYAYQNSKFNDPQR